MRWIIIAALVAGAILLAACNDDSDNNVVTIGDKDLTPDATVVERTAAPTAEATEPPATPPDEGDAIEVQGIIGAIDRDAGIITINPLQGTSIDRVRVEAATEIRSAAGREIDLEALRVSDRIVATGVVEDGVLVAREIAISQGTPGSDPGG